MGKLKLVWKVAEASTGRYRSFQRRGWPIGHYDTKDGAYAVSFQCEDDYTPHRVRTGLHKELCVILVHHNHPMKEGPWKLMRLTQLAKTLDEAKQLAYDFLSRHPEFAPKKEESNGNR